RWRSSSTGQRFGGTGIGLAISHKFARTRPSVRRLQCPSWVGCTTKISDREFPQGQGLKTSGTRSFRGQCELVHPRFGLRAIFSTPDLMSGPGAIQATASRKGPKSRAHGRKLRSTGTRLTSRVAHGRGSIEQLQQQLEARTRELAEAERHADEARRQLAEARRQAAE